jgi:AraC family transcriptional regulator
VGGRKKPARKVSDAVASNVFSFYSPLHLLVAYQHGVRRDGESYVEGLPGLTLCGVAKKIIFVPAGHYYREWYDPRTPIGVTHCYFDLQIDSDGNFADGMFAPHLF